MIVFPDPNVETEYTDPNGAVWEFNGTGWVRQCESSGGDSGDCDGGAPGGNYGDFGSSITLEYQAIKNASGAAVSEANELDTISAININETSVLLTNNNILIWVKHDGNRAISASPLNPPLANQSATVCVHDRFTIVNDEVYFIYKINGVSQRLTKLSYSNGAIQRTDIGADIDLDAAEGGWLKEKVRLFNIQNSKKNAEPLWWLFHSDSATAPFVNIRIGKGPSNRPMLKISDIDLSGNIANTYLSNELDGATTTELKMSAGIARDPVNQYGFVVNVAYRDKNSNQLFHGAFYVDISKGTVQERSWGAEREKDGSGFDPVLGLAHFADKNNIGMLLSYVHGSGVGSWTPAAYAIKLPENRDAFSSDAVIQTTNADSVWDNTLGSEPACFTGSATVLGSYEVTGMNSTKSEPNKESMIPSKVGGYQEVDPVDAYSHDNHTSGGRMLAGVERDVVSLPQRTHSDQSSAHAYFIKTLSCPARTKDGSSYKYVYHLGRGIGRYSFVLHRDRSSPYAGKIKLVPWELTDDLRSKVAVSGGVVSSGIIDGEDAAYAVSDDLWPVYSKCPPLGENQKYSEEYELTPDDELKRVYIFREAVDMTPEEIEQSLTTEES